MTGFAFRGGGVAMVPLHHPADGPPPRDGEELGRRLHHLRWPPSLLRQAQDERAGRN